MDKPDEAATQHADEPATEAAADSGQIEPNPSEAAEYLVAWYDLTLNASHWWGLRAVKPAEAALLLCRLNPHETTVEDAWSITTDATEPEHFKLLLRTFEDLAEHDAQPRRLSAWEQYARVKGLRCHTWVDEYVNACKLVPPSSATAQAAQTTGVLEGQQPAADAPSGASGGTAKRWTADRLEELRDYRAVHGTKAAAEKFGISEARVRVLLPSDKPQPTGYGVFNQRLK